MRKRKDPKKGTGKKPKGTGRRLYTDENPKDTIMRCSRLRGAGDRHWPRR